MSHPHTVPDGWIKGEKLEQFGNGPRYGLGISISSSFSEYQEHLKRFPDGGVFITFDSRHDLLAFLEWWYSDAPAPSLSE
jgi:hypothetical protein